MSRSRNIKPGFFKNEVLVGMPFEFRLLFIGLWTIADRAGRFEDRPTRIRMELFPADSVDVNAGLQSLHDLGFILRYEVDGSRYCQVSAWDKHQSPHFKEQKSLIPAPVKPQALETQVEVKASGKPEASPTVAALIPSSLIPDSKRKAKKEQPPQAAAFVIPEWIQPEVWQGFVEMRKKKRAPLTVRACAMVITELIKLRTAGHEPNAVLDQSTRNTWTDVYAISDKGKPDGSSTRNRESLCDRAARKNGQLDALEAAADRSAAARRIAPDLGADDRDVRPPLGEPHGRFTAG